MAAAGSSPEDELTSSWTRNADAWTQAVRAGAIASRRLATDDAVLDAVIACGGMNVLDVGCGEGWLARRLAQEGRQVTGFDGSDRLIERARELGGGTFVTMDYDAFATDPSAVGVGFDVAVANFSLLGEHLGGLLGAVRRVVGPEGGLVIQTVHPAAVGLTHDGWQEEKFEPLAPLPFAPMPWFFRSRGAWERELETAGWRVDEVREPVNPVTGDVASLILMARLRS